MGSPLQRFTPKWAFPKNMQQFFVHWNNRCNTSSVQPSLLTSVLINVCTYCVVCLYAWIFFSPSILVFYHHGVREFMMILRVKFEFVTWTQISHVKSSYIQGNCCKIKRLSVKMCHNYALFNIHCIHIIYEHRGYLAQILEEKKKIAWRPLQPNIHYKLNSIHTRILCWIC